MESTLDLPSEFAVSTLALVMCTPWHENVNHAEESKKVHETDKTRHLMHAVVGKPVALTATS